MTDAAPGVLLDTCALIWLANEDPISANAKAAIIHAARHDRVFVSSISAWEIGLLSRPRRTSGIGLNFYPDPRTWFARALTGPGIKLAPLTPEIAIDSSWLPGDCHGNPADRLIISTARSLGLPLVTRDSRVLAFAAGGWIRAIAC